MKIVHAEIVEYPKKVYATRMFLTTDKTLIKISYESGQHETCNTKIFDGTQWNHFSSIYDLGLKPEDPYTESARCDRKDMAMHTAEKAVKKLFVLLGKVDK